MCMTEPRENIKNLLLPKNSHCRDENGAHIVELAPEKNTETLPNVNTPEDTQELSYGQNTRTPSKFGARFSGFYWDEIRRNCLK